jgi:hypothetical protein
MGLAFEALAITTTPFFGSSTAELQQRGWATMPQAFTGDAAQATVANCVEHFEGWGWPVAQQRPLVQVYRSANGQRPPTQPYLDESLAKSVGVVPYIVEQAMDDDGRSKLSQLIPATWRAFAQSVAPPDGGGSDMTKIGSQDGVTATANRLREMDPAGTLLVKDSKGKWVADPKVPGVGIEGLTQPLDKWKAYDKFERAVAILVADHDAAERTT